MRGLAAEDLERVAKELAAIVGSDGVQLDGPARTEHERDSAERAPGTSDLVVRAKRREDVAPILRIAQREGLAITPAPAGSSTGGHRSPSAGGLHLDLSGLDRILEISAADRYMVIEPGVTWRQAAEHLAQHHPGLRLGSGFSPPGSTVLGESLMDGAAGLSLRWGGMGDEVIGLEVVLPTGETMRTGAWVWGQTPLGTAPMPGLEGLFVNWRGTTGLVTRAAIELKPTRAHRERVLFLGHDLETSCRLQAALARGDLLDDLVGISWPLGKMLFGEARPMWRHAAEPAVFVLCDWSSDDEELFAAKGRAVERIVAGFRSGAEPLEGPLNLDDLIAIEPRLAQLGEWPLCPDAMPAHAGNLSRVSVSGLCSRWPQAVRACHDHMLARGYPPAVVMRAMRGGQSVTLHMLATFDGSDREELTDLAWAQGFAPYGIDRLVLERLGKRLDPGYRDVLQRVKTALDPGGVMNPDSTGG